MILSVRYVRAGKRHQCELCHKTIEANEMYLNKTEKTTSYLNHHYCIGCDLTAIERLNDERRKASLLRKREEILLAL